MKTSTPWAGSFPAERVASITKWRRRISSARSERVTSSVHDRQSVRCPGTCVASASTALRRVRPGLGRSCAGRRCGDLQSALPTGPRHHGRGGRVQLLARGYRRCPVAGVVRQGAVGSSGYVGSEVDVTVRRSLTKRLGLTVGYSRFFSGRHLEQTGPSEDVDFLYVSTRFTF